MLKPPLTSIYSDLVLLETLSTGPHVENDAHATLKTDSNIIHKRQDGQSAVSSNAPNPTGLSTFVQVSIAIIIVLSLIVIFLFGVLGYCAYKICGGGGMRIGEQYAKYYQ